MAKLWPYMHRWLVFSANNVTKHQLYSALYRTPKWLMKCSLFVIPSGSHTKTANLFSNWPGSSGALLIQNIKRIHLIVRQWLANKMHKMMQNATLHSKYQMCSAINCCTWNTLQFNLLDRKMKRKKNSSMKSTEMQHTNYGNKVHRLQY